MKKILPLLTFTLFALVSAAQDITDGKVNFQKKEQPAVIMEVPYPPSVVEDAIKNYLNRRGSKSNTSSGYQLFKGTIVDSLSNDAKDLYFKVERKSRKERDASVIYVFATQPNENPAKRETFNTEMSGVRSFLRQMQPHLEAQNLEYEIGNQEDEVKKAEKKYDRLVDDGNDMQKRLKKLQENIEDNRKDVEKQKQEIEKQKTILDNMRGKRKG